SISVFELLDTVIFLIMIFYPLNSVVYILKIASSVLFFFYIFWKNYDRENDKLDEDHFFIVGIKPNEFQDFLISIIKEPYGGTGIYAQGKFYHYRHGALQVDNKKYVERLTRLNKYQIKKSIKLDKKRIQVLENLKYSKYKKWSWKNNCKTVLDPVLWRRSKPIF
ncbi:MAG: hypothetical protein GY804_04010, partial [Alphaproteobacteria bacterium]|nr:hypothetical protein [Alphaproteobacteria bacterium]